MKKTLFFISILLNISSFSFSQSYNWITPNKAYLKLSVNDDGMYRISRTDFTNAGINTAVIDPRTVKVFYKGSEIPIYFSGESDGLFDAADYLDFYGTRARGGITKYYTIDNIVAYTKDEYYNFYSDTNAYWIGWDGSNGIRYSTPSFTSTTPYGSSSYFETFHSEKDKVYTQGERSGSEDYRNFNNELFQGEGWYWANMYTNFAVTDTFSAPLLSPVTQTCTFKIFAYPSDINTGINNEHNLVVYVNGVVIASLYKNDFNRFDTTLTFSSSMLSSTSVNQIACQYFANGYDGHVMFDFMEVKYPKIFKFRNNQFSAALNTDTTSKEFRITGFVPGNPMNLYDVNNNYRITAYTNSLDTLIFTGKSNGKFELINKTITKKPYKTAQRQVPNLASATNAADYIIVYNSLFEAQATQLKNIRETDDDFRVIKAEIKDIYDIFNYGIEDPVAVRNFGKYAYDNYQLPKFRYLCLLGRGSLDPKKNSTSTVYYKNFVPVIGNPTSDNYFGNYTIGAFSYVQQVAVGRIPAYSVTEAQTMVDNVIAYSTQTPSAWWKTHIFIVGGGTAADQSLFQSLINPFVDNYIIPPTVSGNPHKIYRTDNTTTVTYNYKDSIRRDIDNGAMMVNFQGHAGNSNWEDGMQDPNTLNNFGKLPLVLSMTCYTGKTADASTRIFGEQFMTMANKGAIGFIGSSGWGWTYSGNQFQNWMLYGFSHDTLRRVGDIIKFGMSKILYDSLSSSVRHTINCYGLIGDPAVKLKFPSCPEFAITSSDYKLSNDFPIINENVSLKIYPKNFGLYADSLKIRFNLKKDNITSITKDTVLRGFKYSDSVSFAFKPDSLQNYTIQAILDYNNWYPNEIKNNNIINISIPLKNISYIQLKPIDNSVIKTDSVEFTGLNPFTKQGVSTIKVLLEMDSTKSFNSPVKKSFAKTNITGVVTKFKTSIPILNSNVVYYWRTNAVINGDSSGWTKAQSFSYNPLAVMSASETKTVSSSSLLADSNNIVISKFKSNQFPSQDLYNTNYGTSGIGLNQFPLKISVRSMGSNGAEISYFYVNDKAVNYDGGRSPGLNMMKVKRLNGHIIDFKNFKMTSSSSSDSVVNYLNTFDSTYYLLALNASYVDYNLVQQMNSTARAKIRSFGSTKIDSMYKFGYFDTWSFIGYLGATAPSVSEQYFKYTVSLGWLESNSSITSVYKETGGTVTNYIGPTQGLSSFSWQPTLNPLSNVLFDVVGTDRNGAQTVLLSNQSTNSFVNLSTIDHYQYPYINLLSKINIDTVTGSLTSYLNSVKAYYNAPAELVPDLNTLSLSDTLIRIGNEVKINFNYYNVGYVNLPGAIVNIYKVSSSPQNLIKSDTITTTLKIDSVYNYYSKFNVPYYRAGTDNKLPVYVEIIPKGQYNEVYTFNNPLSFNLTLRTGITSPAVVIYSDGVIVNSGDIIRSKPEMKISITKEIDEMKKVSSYDTSQFLLKLNDQIVPFYVNGKINSKLKISEDGLIDGKSSGVQSLLYYPSFSNGTNRLSVIYKNNSLVTDTVSYDFIVNDILSVKDLYNYPNPMKDKTSFVFSLLGSVNPVSSKIKIYTSAGRLIKELNFTAAIGYNQVEWDGRDDDGDYPANGTYLYKIVTDDESKTETAVQKLVVLR